jgi:site-specific DNA-methyltransferase (adenine-specific)
MEYMATLEDNAFDLAIVDPPYRDQNQPTKEMRQASRKSNSLRFVKTEILGLKPSIGYFSELARTSKNQIVWGANNFSANGDFKGIAIWVKTNIPENFSMSMAEIASVSDDLSTVAKVFYYTCNRGGESIHPTQKPVKLYQWLLQNYAKPGQRILDTHLGSGSSAIAAHYYGCDFVGCELDRDYYDAACKRFDKETRQETLFERGSI